jgi:hypothetical protein
MRKEYQKIVETFDLTNETINSNFIGIKNRSIYGLDNDPK